MEEYDFMQDVPFEKGEAHSTEKKAPAKAALVPGEVMVINTEEGYTAYSAIEQGGVYVRVSEISFSKQSVSGKVDIELNVKDGPKHSINRKLDLLSGSAFTVFVSLLNAVYGKQYSWASVIAVSFQEITKLIMADQKPQSGLGMVAEEASFLLRPFLQENVSNLLFAESEAGKTWFAITMATALATGRPFLGYTGAKLARTLFIDYEDDFKTFVSRLHKICAGLGVEYESVAKHIEYFKPQSSMRNNVELVKSLVVKNKYDLIVIDAGGDAAGGSPSDEEKVLDLFNALDEIRCTKLILHHEPKNVQNEAAAFFGSMYWKARSRVGWRLQVEKEEGSSKLIKATIQKRSNLPYHEPIRYHMHFDSTSLDDMFGEIPVPQQFMVRLELLSQRETYKNKDLNDVAREYFAKEGERTIAQFVQMTGISRNKIYRGIEEGGRLREVIEPTADKKGVTWRLKK